MTKINISNDESWQQFSHVGFHTIFVDVGRNVNCKKENGPPLHGSSRTCPALCCRSFCFYSIPLKQEIYDNNHHSPITKVIRNKVQNLI